MRRPERIAPCGAEAQLFAGACQMLKSHQPSSIMLKHKLMRRVMAIARVAGPDGHPVLVLYLVQADTPSPGLCIFDDHALQLRSSTVQYTMSTKV